MKFVQTLVIILAIYAMMVNSTEIHKSETTAKEKVPIYETPTYLTKKDFVRSNNLYLALQSTL